MKDALIDSALIEAGGESLGDRPYIRDPLSRPGMAIASFDYDTALIEIDRLSRLLNEPES